MNIMKKTCGLLAVIALGFNIAACSTADKGKPGSGTTVLVPVAQDDGGNSFPFAANPPLVQVGDTSTLNWAVQGAESCTASSPSDPAWKGTKNTSGSFSVGPYTQEGSYVYVLNCSSPTGGVLSQTATVTVGKPASTIGVSLSSNTSTAKPGETVSLNWTSSGNPTACTASSNPSVGDWSGNVSTVGPTAGQWVTLPNAGSYVLTLTCSGAGGMASSSVPITVSNTEASAPPLLMISATPASVAQGASSLIQWKTANATSCAAASNGTADGWDGSTRPVNDIHGGSAPATFTTSNSLSPNTYSYSLTCAGTAGTSSVTQSAQLVVTSGGNGGGSASVVPTLTFTVSNSTTLTGNNSTSVKVGDRAYLSWVSTNATSCAATGGMWAASSQPTSYNNLPEGPFTSPGIYDFALTCSNSSGNSVAQVVQVNVTSNGPSVSFSAQPGSTTQGAAATLVWAASSDATSCAAVSGPTQDTTWSGALPTSGSHAIPSSVYNSPGTYQYVLSCTGPSGTTTVPVTYTVNPGSTGGPQFTGDFNASTTNLPPAGGSTTLTWATSNATACSATSTPPLSGWSGAQPTNSPSGGTTVMLPANTGSTPISYNLQLTCTDGSNSITQTQMVTVQGQSAMPAPTVTLSADPLTIVAGSTATTTLTYSTSNATSCTTAGGTGAWATQPVPNAGSTPATGTAASTPMTVAGSYTYTLTCTGPGGTYTAAPVTVVATSSDPGFTPVHGQSASSAGLFVATAPNSNSGVTATQVAPGGDLYFSWASSNTDSCVPSSTEPSPTIASWQSANTGTSGDDMKVTASNVPGSYTYTITCKGSSGTDASSTVSVLVISPTASFCPMTPTAAGQPIASMALLVDSLNAPSYAATTPSATGSSVCVGCSVGASPNVLANLTNDPAVPAQANFPYGFTDYASMILPVGAFTANAEEINVRNADSTTVVYPAGRTVNVGLVVPDSLVLASVIGNVSISTTLNGVVRDQIPPGALSLQLLGVVGSGSAGYATLPTTKTFDGVRVNFGGTVTALSPIEVHMACVSLQ